MESGEQDGAAVRLPPPLVYLASTVAGALVHGLMRPLPLRLTLGWRIAAAGTAAVIGLALASAAIGLFKRTDQDPKPWKSTPEIISGGIYRFTRNPMYLGLGFLQAAIGFCLQNGWIVALAPLTLAVVYVTAVRHEEAYLERKFGERYLEYKQSVRRWL